MLRQGVLWLTMLGASLAASYHRHIRLDLLTRVFPEYIVKPAEKITDLFAVFICLLLTQASWVYVASEKEFESTLMVGVPSWPFASILVIGFASLAVKFLFQVLGVAPFKEEESS